MMKHPDGGYSTLKANPSAYQHGIDPTWSLFAGIASTVSELHELRSNPDYLAKMKLSKRYMNRADARAIRGKRS